MSDSAEQELDTRQGTWSLRTDAVAPVAGGGGDHPRVDAATARAARAFLRLIEGRYPVREVLLFGSRARGTHHAGSDADFAVVLAGECGARGRVSGEMAEIAFDVLMETDILVQAVPLWEGELRQPERFSNPALLASIRRDGLRL